MVEIRDDSHVKRKKSSGQNRGVVACLKSGSCARSEKDGAHGEMIDDDREKEGSC